MTTEEKATAYDELRTMLSKSPTDKYGCIIGVKPADLIPELQENEDEKIRGAIIDHLKDNNLIEWAAWLEKQKPIEEVNGEEYGIDSLQCPYIPAMKGEHLEAK